MSMMRRFLGNDLLIAAAVALAVGLASVLPSCTPPPARTVADVRGVVVTGRGATESSARREAVAAGTRQLVGEFIEAEVEVEGDRVVSERVRGFSSAPGISSRQVGEARQLSTGEFEVTMIVEIDPNQDRRRSGATGIDSVASLQVQGAAMAAELEVLREDRRVRDEIVRDRAPRSPASAMQAILVDSSGRPRVSVARDEIVRLGPTRVEVPILVEIGFDRARWHREIRPRFHDLLMAACDRFTPRGAVFASSRVEAEVVPVDAPVWTADPVLWAGDAVASGGVPDRPVVLAPWPREGRDLVGLLVEISPSGDRAVFDCYEVEPLVLASIRAADRGTATRGQASLDWIRMPLGIEIEYLDRNGSVFRRDRHPLSARGGDVETLVSIRGSAVAGQITGHRGRPWFFDPIRFRDVRNSGQATLALMGPWFVGTGSLEQIRPTPPRGGWAGPGNWPVSWDGPRSWFFTATQRFRPVFELSEFEQLAGIDVRIVAD